MSTPLGLRNLMTEVSTQVSNEKLAKDILALK